MATFRAWRRTRKSQKCFRRGGRRRRSPACRSSSSSSTWGAMEVDRPRSTRGRNLYQCRLGRAALAAARTYTDHRGYGSGRRSQERLLAALPYHVTRRHVTPVMAAARAATQCHHIAH